jgi:hypothetical protein
MIARFAIALVALFFAGDAFSRSLDSISSCDHLFTISNVNNYNIRLKSSKKVYEVYLGHDLNGGSIDPVASMFVVYGLPKNINLDNPQLMTVSVYTNLTRPIIVERINLAGGIYAASFSKDHRFIIINTRFGDVIFDIKRKKTTALSLAAPTKIELTECKN